MKLCGLRHFASAFIKANDELRGLLRRVNDLANVVLVCVPELRDDAFELRIAQECGARIKLSLLGVLDFIAVLTARLQVHYHAGLLVKIDEEGFVYILDRKKDMIIVNGLNVYPRDIDEVMFKHPKVVEVCTIGIPDEKQGESVKTFVVVKPGETHTADEVIAFCREQLAPYKVPRFVEFVDAVPRTAVGKADRKVLKEKELSKIKN